MKGILILLLYSTNPILGQTSSSPPKIAITGLYHEEIPSPSTFYQTVAPIVFQFQIPKWNQTEISLPIGGSNCTTPEWSESSICPTKFYLPDVQARFSEYLFNAQPLVNTFEYINASPQVSDIQFECGTLRKHFRDIYIDSPVMENYLTKLKKCSPIGEMDFYKKIPNYNYNISEVYLKMRQGFFSEVWMKVHDGRIDAGLWSNALNVLHSLAYSNYYIEANRWKFGLSDCQSGKIPVSLLPPALLSDSLQDLFESLDKVNLTSVISPDDVGNYYKAKVADCTFTNDSFIVRLLIPVTHIHQSHSLIRIKSSRFWDNKNNLMCWIELKSIYYLIDHIANVVYQTDCKPNELCHVPSAKEQGKIDSCVSAYINKHYGEIVKYCKLTCEPLSPYQLTPYPLIVQQMNLNTFAVAAGSNSIKNGEVVKDLPKLKIRCKNGNLSTIITKSESLVIFRTMEVTLPCNCQLEVDYVIFEPTGACVESNIVQPRINQVVPFHWIRQGKLDELKKRKLNHPIQFEFMDKDLEIKESYSDASIVSKQSYSPSLTTTNTGSSSREKLNGVGDEESSEISTGIKLLLTFYFLLLLIGFCMLAFLTFRLKSMGVNVNPLTIVRGGQEISYRNVQQRNNGMLINEES